MNVPVDQSFRELFLGFLADRQQQLGVEEGGLHAFYSRRLELRRVFNDGETAAASLILGELPSYDAYVEIGPGFGQFAAWLAVQGRRVIAVERDKLRFDGLDALRQRVAGRWPDTKTLFATVFSAFPCSIPNVDPGQTLIVTTNLIFGAAPEVEQAIIDGIGGYAGALVDTLRFCRERDDGAALEALDARFAAAGLPVQSQVWPSGVAGGAGERIMWYRRSAERDRGTG